MAKYLVNPAATKLVIITEIRRPDEEGACLALIPGSVHEISDAEMAKARSLNYPIDEVLDALDDKPSNAQPLNEAASLADVEQASSDKQEVSPAPSAPASNEAGQSAEQGGEHTVGAEHGKGSGKKNSAKSSGKGAGKQKSKAKGDVQKQ